MKRKSEVPPKLTKEETERLEKYISMADWHFEILFLGKCTQVSSHIIHWGMTKKSEPAYAKVYGINAVPVAAQKPVLVNFFIRYEVRVYGVPDIIKATEIIKLLEKEATYNKYRSNTDARNWDVQATGARI